MASPLEVTLTLDLDQHLAHFVGYNEDGDAVQEPTTIEDVVLGLAARQLVAGLDRDAQRDLATRVRSIRDEVIREQVEPLIREAIVRAVQPTDGYGNPKGEPKTMGEVIVAEATALLSKPIDRYNGGGTFIAKIIRDEIGAAFTKELKTAADAAKAEMVAAIRAKGTDVIAQTITSMAGVK